MVICFSCRYVGWVIIIIMTKLYINLNKPAEINDVVSYQRKQNVIVLTRHEQEIKNNLQN